MKFIVIDYSRREIEQVEIAIRRGDGLYQYLQTGLSDTFLSWGKGHQPKSVEKGERLRRKSH